MFHRISITHVQLLNLKQLLNNCNGLKRLHGCVYIRSRVAQWKRAGPITQRSEDRNLALLYFYFYFKITVMPNIVLHRIHNKYKPCRYMSEFPNKER